MIAAAPELVVTPMAQQVPLHSILTLHCEATGNPPPTILWLFNDSLASGHMNRNAHTYLVECLQIAAEGRREIDRETNTLQILNTMVSEDSGLYTCLAWNQVGTDQHTVAVQVVDVRGEPSPSAIT